MSVKHDKALNELKIVQLFLDQIIKCKGDTRRGQQQVFNADFNMLFPFIWRSTPTNVPPYKEYGKNLVSLVSEHRTVDPGFQLYFTLPSFLELLDSFHHHASNAEHLLSQSRTYELFKKNNLENLVFRGSAISTRDAQKELEKIKHTTNKSHIRQSLERAQLLIGSNGAIRGLDDCIHNDIHYKKKHKTLFEQLYKAMDRGRSPKDDRKVNDRFFHYKIDASNIITTFIVNDYDGYKSMFVTHQSMISQFCPDNGLNAMMPYLWFSSFLMCSENASEYGDHEFFLKIMSRRVRECIDTLGHFTDKDLPSTYLKIVDDFYADYFLPIHRYKHYAPQTNRQVLYQNGDLTFESYMDFKGKLEEVRDEIGDAARSLVESAPYLMDKEPLDVFDLKEDPVVDAIRKNFSLK